MIRKAYCSILLFYFVLHFLFPLVYYYLYGYFTIYSEQEFNISIFKGVLLNFIAIFGAIAFIYLIPVKQKKIEPLFDHALSFLAISFFVMLAGLLLSGGFEGALSGELNGTIVSYLSLFFDSSTALVAFLFYKKRIKYGVAILIVYVILMTVLGSRSAIIIVILSFLMLPGFKNELLLYSKMKKLILFLSLVSPLLFYYGTSVRGYVDTTYLLQSIVGRISMVELSAIPIEGKDTGYMDVELYNRKYGLVSQLKQVVNEVTPIDPFEYDVNPNQYYRAIFKGAREENVLDKYLSINMTFPTYLYMSTNFFMACILAILMLTSLYYFLVKHSYSPLVVICILLNLYYLLYFFDWIMIASGLFRTTLTIVALKSYNRYMNIFSSGFKSIIKSSGIH